MPAGMYLDEMFGRDVAPALASRWQGMGLGVERAALHRPGTPDSAQLAFARTRGLVLVTRNLRDFRQLHQLWQVLRHWEVLPHPHAGILIPAGLVEDVDWVGIVADLLLSPNCPPLEDQLLIWQAKPGRWVADHPYSSRRERPVRL